MHKLCEFLKMFEPKLAEGILRPTNNLLQMYTGDEIAGVVGGRCFCADYICTLVD